MAERHADALFGAGDSNEAFIADNADIKGRMAKYGRRPDEMKIIPGVTFFVGQTAAEADELHGELNALISPALGVSYLSTIVTKDLSGYDIDGPLPEVPETAIGGSGSSTRTFTIQRARKDNLSIRQTHEQVVPGLGSPVIKGTASQAADEMEDYYRSKACDGVMVSNPMMPVGLCRFVELVVP